MNKREREKILREMAAYVESKGKEPITREDIIIDMSGRACVASDDLKKATNPHGLMCKYARIPIHEILSIAVDFAEIEEAIQNLVERLENLT